MGKFELRVDGERVARVDDEEAVREWIAKYREQHGDDDPAAAHVQVIQLRFMGGKLIPRERFF
ncbi:MAG TPA: hypothetical protein VE736_13275 [Gaiellaceae bacterium]|jgi:hypothetical protein|nr:hypothetical protein [Gaiellaceae bacterium]